MAVGLRQFSGYLTLGEVWSSRCSGPALCREADMSRAGLGAGAGGVGAAWWAASRKGLRALGTERRLWGRRGCHPALRPFAPPGPETRPCRATAERDGPVPAIEAELSSPLFSLCCRDSLLCLSVSDGFTEDGVYSAPLRVIKTLGP